MKIATQHGMKLDARRIQSIQLLGDGAAAKVIFDDGHAEVYGFLFHKLSTQLTGDFARSLELETTTSGSITIDSTLQETSRRGNFACGDCVSPMKQVIVAMADGAKAAFGANEQLAEEDFPRNFW